ncbi:type II secretion system protein [Microcoleus sp. FACHB-SPT15]|uniref:prepilin-type N-terminal cleavage/methylation domain-containing protein n=1 Tax=Microcoleus sp. FACHB-SPT15 TaxID=2692830 RepID=UPI00177DA705|nr:prepilin-type N-terminal cleavage/methylation domain-containing protein [Microcoleus sp. FACHB-SPT15]MBD1806890.1 type II secretion system protein [Microcoleus sp. FACHB-SPT15]
MSRHDNRSGVETGEATVEEKTREIAFSQVPLSKPSQSTQSGFTIIESLLAMMIVTILLVGISPLLVLSTASRVQARRIDLATQAARSYVDALRANAILPPGRDNADFTAADLGVPAPPNIPNQVRNPRTCLDKNLQPLVPCSNPAFVIQAFRDPLPNGGTDTDFDGTTQTEAQQQGYCLGLRVYRGDAFGGGNAPSEIKPLPSMFTETANTKEYPLVVMTTQIINRTSFEQYQNRFPDDDGDPTTPRKGSSCQ